MNTHRPSNPLSHRSFASVFQSWIAALYRGLFHRSAGGVFDMRPAKIYVETALIKRPDTDEKNRTFHPDDERIFVGKQGAVAGAPLW